MKKGDVAAGLIILAAVFLLVVWPDGHFWARKMAREHRYEAGLLLFIVLGPTADYLKARLTGGPGLKFFSPRLWVGWVLFGLIMSLGLWLIYGGVTFLQASGLLPGGGYGLGGRGLATFFSSSFFTRPLFAGLVTAFFLLPAIGFWFRPLGASGGEAKPGDAADSYFYFWPAISAVPGGAAGLIWGLVLIRSAFFTLIFMLPADLWLVTTACLGSVVAMLEGLSLRAAPRGEAGPEK